MSLLLLFSSSGGGGGSVTGTGAFTIGSLTLAGTGETTIVSGTGAFTIGDLTLAGEGAGSPVTATGAFTIGTFRMAAVGSSSATNPDTGAAYGTTGVQVRAVTQTGTMVNLIAANITRITRAVNGQESCEGTIPNLHPDATAIDLFSHEIQVWLDGELYFWGRPARIDASASELSDETAFVIDGLFSYFHDEVVGGQRDNHITSPHEDASAVGAAPTSWTKTSKVEDAAIVSNNAEFWQTPKAIQVNNSEAGEDAYIYQRYTVPADFDGVPFALMAYCYIGDDHGGAPAWGGAAYQQRGLMLMKLDGATSNPLAAPKVARITDDTPRNTVVRLQTDPVLPKAGDILDIRCYAPDAWTVWRFVGLYDGRALKADRIDKTEAVRMLADHAQDTSLGKQDHNITVDITTIGEPISREWAWHNRANIGEEMVRLADTFEFHMVVTETTRELRVKRQVGTARSWVLTKADFHAWGLGAELGNAYSKVIGQGQGDGIARDEWFANNPDALNGNVREKLWFAPPDTALAQLRDQTAHELEKVQAVIKLPRAVISGARALEARPGDTVTVNLDHGAGQFAGAARCMQISLDPQARKAELSLEPVTA